MTEEVKEEVKEQEPNEEQLREQHLRFFMEFKRTMKETKTKAQIIDMLFGTLCELHALREQLNIVRGESNEVSKDSN